jgi:hypothetical protein
MMNRTIAVLAFASLLSTLSISAFATQRPVEETTLPPNEVPGINQSNVPESNAEKANKKGEEAAGSNSGAESGSLKKEADATSDADKAVGGEPGS